MIIRKCCTSSGHLPGTTLDLIYCLWLLYTLLLAGHKFYFTFGVGWDNLCGSVVSNGPWLTWLNMEHGGTTVEKGRPKSWKTICLVPSCPKWNPQDLPQHRTQTPVARTRQLPAWYTGQTLVTYVYLVCKITYHFFLLVDKCCALVVPKCTLNLCQIHRGVVVVKYSSRYNWPMIKTQHIGTH